MPSVQFNDLAKLFAEHFRRVQNCVDPRYVRPDWVARNLELERHLLPVPPVDFLRHPAIRYQMFVDERVVAHELPFIRRRLPDDHLLAEDPIGDPPTTTLPDSGVRTSSNTVHQLFHLLRYEETTGRQLGDIGTVVEWGGGFGSLMRLLVRRHGGQPTCVIFDTPIFSAVQWLYLSAVLGEAASFSIPARRWNLLRAGSTWSRSGWRWIRPWRPICSSRIGRSTRALRQPSTT